MLTLLPIVAAKYGCCYDCDQGPFVMPDANGHVELTKEIFEQSGQLCSGWSDPVEICPEFQLPSYAFYMCDADASFSVTTKVSVRTVSFGPTKQIASYAFGYSALERLDLEDSVVDLVYDRGAFYHTSKLAWMSLPLDRNIVFRQITGKSHPNPHALPAPQRGWAHLRIRSPPNPSRSRGRRLRRRSRRSRTTRGSRKAALVQ